MSPRSPYTCIGDSTGDLRHFDITFRCAAHYARATLKPAIISTTCTDRAANEAVTKCSSSLSVWLQCRFRSVQFSYFLAACPIGWHYKFRRCYLCVSSARNWPTASNTCQQTHAGNLVSIDAAEQSIISYYVYFAASSHRWIWTGLNDR